MAPRWRVAGQEPPVAGRGGGPGRRLPKDWRFWIVDMRFSGGALSRGEGRGWVRPGHVSLALQGREEGEKTNRKSGAAAAGSRSGRRGGSSDCFSHKMAARSYARPLPQPWTRDLHRLGASWGMESSQAGSKRPQNGGKLQCPACPAPSRPASPLLPRPLLLQWWCVCLCPEPGPESVASSGTLQTAGRETTTPPGSR